MTENSGTGVPADNPVAPVAPIAMAIADIAGTLDAIEKRTMGKGNYTYKAFSVDDVFDAVRPRLAALHIAVFPQTPTVVYTEHVKADGKVQTTAQYSGRWLLVHGPTGDEQMVGFEASSRDGGDKSAIMAAQQAEKYLYIQMFQISAGDPEAEQPPDDALDPLAVAAEEAKNLERLRNGARQHLFELSGSDKGLAEERWPLVLTKAGLDGVMSQADQVKVNSAADELYGPDPVDDAGEQEQMEDTS